jgi:hypothetical protein
MRHLTKVLWTSRHYFNSALFIATFIHHDFSYFFSVSSQLVNAESTFSKLIEFEIEKERLVKLQEEAAANNANTNMLI